tara:strand:+ start:3225 stop:3812 length:588 start_codon:yes stop_codon:yes gene_type:complete
MIRICVLGGIGSGKSFVAKLFSYPVFNADNEVNHIYKNDINCYRKLRKKLPKYIKSFPVNKSYLIDAITANRKNLKKISSIIHPIVRNRMKKFLKKKKKYKFIILDIPLLIENKLNKKDDVLIFVKSNKNKTLSRLKKRGNFNKKILKNLRESQSLLSKKKKLANYVLDNNFSINIMKKKIKLIKKKIINERSST